MSEKFTEIEPGAGSGYGLWGHVPPDEAIAEALKFYEGERDKAIASIAAIKRGDVGVFHQLGPWARRNRRQVNVDGAQ